MFDDMIATVRAALSPGADAATKQRAAVILRGVVSMLEADPSPVDAATAPAAAVAAAAPVPDVLGVLIEAVRQRLPPGAVVDVPRFQIPIVRAPR